MIPARMSSRVTIRCKPRASGDDPYHAQLNSMRKT